MNSLCAASAAGLAASLPMLTFMELMRRALPDSEGGHRLPPRQITMDVAEKAGVSDRLNEPGRLAATLAAHCGFGATAGALYAPTAARLPLPPVVKGIGYGLAVWATSYLGWLPATGLQPPVTRRPAGRNATIIASHVVWGAALGLLADYWRPKPASGR